MIADADDMADDVTLMGAAAAVAAAAASRNHAGGNLELFAEIFWFEFFTQLF